MTEIRIQPIGWVSSPRTEVSDDFWGGIVSRITLDPARFGSEALAGLADFSHVEIIFHFHRIPPDADFPIAGHPRENPRWPKVGIFAQRKKLRPNRLGHTICRLLKVEGDTLIVANLDAVDGTPVVDIKPGVREFLPERGEVRQPAWTTELMRDYFATPAAAPGENVLAGGCHCRNVGIEWRSRRHPAETEVRACACSFCTRHGARNVSDPVGELRLRIADEKRLHRYRFALRTVDFLICRECGVYVAAVMRSPDRSVATLNIQALDERQRFTRAPAPVSYDGESAAQRIERRRTNWTPCEIKIL